LVEVTATGSEPFKVTVDELIFKVLVFVFTDEIPLVVNENPLVI
jgi:hypothetical protein